MGLSDRSLKHSNPGADAIAAQPSLVVLPQNRQVAAPPTDGFRELKGNIQQLLLETVDLAKLESLEPSLMTSKLTETIDQLLREQTRLITDSDRARLIKEIKNEILGLVPLEPLLHDDTINDVLVNGAKQVYVERQGKLELTDVTFHDDRHLLHIIGRIVSRVGRRVDESVPMVDARLPDGSRVNAIIPPPAIDGPSLSIRRFGKDPYTIANLAQNGSLTPQMVEFLRIIVMTRFNILVVGGTGSGKTTMLNCLSSFIPVTERIVTIEDAAELGLQQPHVVRLETPAAKH